MFSAEHYLDEYLGLIARLDTPAIDGLAEVLLGAWKSNRTVFVCGNGGSASSAGHFAADLTKLTAPDGGPRLRALALTDSMAAISAIANDIAYDEVFVEQLRAFIQPDDVVVAFSTSGASPNVLRAVEYANREGAITVAVTGARGLRLRALARHTLVLPSSSVQQVEDATLVVGHLLCLKAKALVDRELGRKDYGEETSEPDRAPLQDQPFAWSDEGLAQTPVPLRPIRWFLGPRARE